MIKITIESTGDSAHNNFSKSLVFKEELSFSKIIEKLKNALAFMKKDNINK